MLHPRIDAPIDCPMPTWNAQDRRRAPRYPSSAEILYYPATSPRTEARSARVYDLSDSGIGLLLPHAIERGVLLFIELPATESSPSSVVCARVAHSSPQEDGEFLVGCSLQNELTPEVLQALAASNHPAS